MLSDLWLCSAHRAAVMRWMHWLSHRLGTNTGEVEVFWSGLRLMVGFRCHQCGELNHVHESVVTPRRTHASSDSFQKQAIVKLEVTK